MIGKIYTRESPAIKLRLILEMRKGGFSFKWFGRRVFSSGRERLCFEVAN